jgi:hypothetical protein
MRRLCKEFGVEYAGRGIVDLSFLAKITDVGLVGTRVGDLDTDQAGVGVGVKSTKDENELLANASGDILDANSNLSDEETPVATITGAKTKPRAISPADKLVPPGRGLVQLARLSRRYLGRELAKGDVRTSNWDRFLSKDQLQCQYLFHLYLLISRPNKSDFLDAANDVHAGLAIYHALRFIHARSIAEGVIPVPAPPPWDDLISTTESP